MHKFYFQFYPVNPNENKRSNYTCVPSISFKTLVKRFLFPIRNVIKDKILGGKNHRMIALKGTLKIIY